LRLLRVIKLNRLLRLSKLSKHLKQLEVSIQFNPSMLRVSKLMIIMISCCHWMGCLWWFIADLELNCIKGNVCDANEWQPNNELLQSSLGPQFSAAFYWGASFVTTMVPYDIEPKTSLEVYVTSTCMFVGLLLNAFVIGSMASAFASLDAKKEMCRGKLDMVSSYLRIQHVPVDLHNRILEFYTYQYTSSQSMIEDLNLFKVLPPSLAARLAINIHHKIVSRAAMFAALEDGALLAALAQLKPGVYVPGQVIHLEGQLIRFVSFLKRGSVQLLHGMGKENEREVRIVGQHDSFGLSKDMIVEMQNYVALVRKNDMIIESLGRRYASDSGRAISYCDVFHLAIGDLVNAFRLSLEIVRSRAAEGDDTVTLRKGGTAYNFASKLLKRTAPTNTSAKNVRATKRDATDSAGSQHAPSLHQRDSHGSDIASVDEGSEQATSRWSASSEGGLGTPRTPREDDSSNRKNPSSEQKDNGTTLPATRSRVNPPDQ